MFSANVAHPRTQIIRISQQILFKWKIVIVLNLDLSIIDDEYYLVNPVRVLREKYFPVYKCDQFEGLVKWIQDFKREINL